MKFFYFLRVLPLTSYGLYRSLLFGLKKNNIFRNKLREHNPMARPRHKNPTPAELEVLQMIWEHGPCTVRKVMNLLSPKRPRAYTSVMSLMNVMAEKGLLNQKPRGRAFIYSAKVSRDKTKSRLLSDLLNRAFDGSASALVAHLLQQAEPDREELDEIHKTISEFTQKKGGGSCQS
jgi:BlaI family penicillinase repressor